MPESRIEFQILFKKLKCQIICANKELPEIQKTKRRKGSLEMESENRLPGRRGEQKGSLVGHENTCSVNNIFSLNFSLLESWQPPNDRPLM